LAKKDSEIIEPVLSIYERSLKHAIKAVSKDELWHPTPPYASRPNGKWIASGPFLVEIETLLIKHKPAGLFRVLDRVYGWALETHPELRQRCVMSRLWSGLEWRNGPARQMAEFICKALEPGVTGARAEAEAIEAATVVAYGGYACTRGSGRYRRTETLGANVWPHLPESKRKVLIRIAFHEREAASIGRGRPPGILSLAQVFFNRGFVDPEFYSKWLFKNASTNADLSAPARWAIWQELVGLDVASEVVSKKQMAELKKSVQKDCREFIARAIRLIRDPGADPRLRTSHFKLLKKMRELIPDETFHELEKTVASLKPKPSGADSNTARLMREFGIPVPRD
jgi:hypothetical protein